MVRVNAVFVEVERMTGRARRIERVTRDWSE
jgi:hypothetical protein